MAVPKWTSAALSAYETTYKAADKPILGTQATPITPTDVRWNTAGTINGASATAAGYPTCRAYDGLPNFATKPDAANAGWYLVFDFGSSGVEFDSLLLVGHNLGTSVATLILQLDSTNMPAGNPDGSFGSSETLLTSDPFSDDTRYAAWDLHHTGAVPLRYSDVRYARLRFTAGGAITPNINEVIFCRRRQMIALPDVPYDDYRKGISKEATITNSGMVSNYTRWKGRYELGAEYQPDQTTQIDDLKAWHAGRHYGRSEFVWCPLPYSADQDWYLMTDVEGGMEFPLADNPSRRRFQLDAIEQGPEDYYLSVEAA